MNIKVSTNISNEFEEIDIQINTPKLNSDVQKIISYITAISDEKDTIIASKDNEIFLLKSKDIFYFFSDEKYNYAKTKEGVFRIKQRLYELEEILPQNKYIRISSSHLINIDKIISFDVSQIGSLFAKMEDGEKLEVSKRRMRDVRQFLNERR